MSNKLKSGIIGLLAGIVNGFLGAGGGLIVVPLLRRWGKLSEKQALATSVMVITPLCLVSFGVYGFKIGAENLLPHWTYLAGGLIGGVLAGGLFSKISPKWLRRIFGTIMIVGGIRMLMA